MVAFPSRSKILSLGIALVLLASLGPQPLLASDVDPDPQPLTAGLGCLGHTFELDDTGMCTHGADPVPDFIDERGGPSRFSRLTPTLNGTTAVGCDGDGTSGKRVQALYVHISGRPNRRRTWIDSFRTWASNVDAMFRESAAETGGNRRLRWVTNNCRLNVPVVAVSAAAETNFGTLIGELSAQGYNRNDRKYLIWIDSDRSNHSGCGVATVYGDDRPTGNLNNERATYARIDYICWDFAEQHEMMHTLGAVQVTAPNATPGLHCADEYDQMCYKDRTDVVIRYVCPSRYERLFDCGHDDYFSTAPTPGSYLATHWNTANSGWLINAPPPPSPPANDPFAAAATLGGLSGERSGTTLAASAESGEAAATATASPIDSVWHSWTAGAAGVLLLDTCGSALDTTLGVWTGSAVSALTLIAGNDDDASAECGADSRLQVDVLNGNTYHVSVDGRGTAEGGFRLNWQFVPAGADLVAPTVQPARASLTMPQTLTTTVRVLITWPEATDESGIGSYRLQRRRDNRTWIDVPLAAPTDTSVETTLPVGSAYSFRVRATDGAGNLSPWMTSSTGTLALLQESASQVSYSGRFRVSALNGASGGYVRRAGAAGRVATFSFTGRAVGFVTTLGPDRGIAEIRLDGGEWQEVDLYASVLGTRRVIWTAAPTHGPHALQVRVTGGSNSASAGSRVDIDAFLNWR